MRYLKSIFENIEFKGKFYLPIDTDFYNQYSQTHNKSEFTNSERDYINKLLKNGYKVFPGINFNSERYPKLKYTIMFGNENNFHIMKYDDEIFLVQNLTDCKTPTGLGTTISHYMCDQLDGVIQLLRDKKMIH
jgi:hypothetical protein